MTLSARILHEPLRRIGAGIRCAVSGAGAPEWHLRTKLVLATLTLLALTCCLVCTLSYAVMDAFLTGQLDSQLAQASLRASGFHGQQPGTRSGPASGPGGARVPRTGADPLNAPGQGPGTLNAVISANTLISAGLRRADGTVASLSGADAAVLAGLPRDGNPRALVLSTGSYRLMAAPAPTGDVIITGLPLAARDRTLKSLLTTMAVASAAGLALTAACGTLLVRRTLRPLEDLSGIAGRVARLQLGAGDVSMPERVRGPAADPHTEVGRVGDALNLMLGNVAGALQARQRSEATLRRFVADASHELRTPLTAIRGYTELLGMTERFSHDGAASLARLRAQVMRMGTLIEDLLLLARLDDGTSLHHHQVDLTGLALDAVTRARSSAPGHTWRLELDHTGPSLAGSARTRPGREELTVTGDPNTLARAVRNLLTNAAQHTPPGTIVITTVTRSAEGQALITVTDNGPGLPPPLLDTVFTRSTRTKTRNRTDGSTGLGLALTDAVVTAHQGSLELRSTPGRTQFRIRLPLKTHPALCLLPDPAKTIS